MEGFLLVCRRDRHGLVINVSISSQRKPKPGSLRHPFDRQISFPLLATYDDLLAPVSLQLKTYNTVWIWQSDKSAVSCPLITFSEAGLSIPDGLSQKGTLHGNADLFIDYEGDRNSMFPRVQ